MRISGRFLRGESHNAPFFPSILLSVRAAVEKKEAAYAKLLNRPEGQANESAPQRRDRQFICDRAFVLNRKSAEVCDEVICFV
jgi:hypothetical protein